MFFRQYNLMDPNTNREEFDVGHLYGDKACILPRQRAFIEKKTTIKAEVRPKGQQQLSRLILYGPKAGDYRFAEQLARESMDQNFREGIYNMAGDPLNLVASNQQLQLLKEQLAASERVNASMMQMMQTMQLQQVSHQQHLATLERSGSAPPMPMGPSSSQAGMVPIVPPPTCTPQTSTSKRRKISVTPPDEMEDDDENWGGLTRESIGSPNSDDSGVVRTHRESLGRAEDGPFTALTRRLCPSPCSQLDGSQSTPGSSVNLTIS